MTASRVSQAQHDVHRHHDGFMSHGLGGHTERPEVGHVLDAESWRHASSAWKPDVLLDVLTMVCLGDGDGVLASRLAAMIVPAQDLVQVEVIRFGPDGSVRRCSPGRLRGNLATWVIDCVWGRPDVSAEFARGCTVAWFDEAHEPRSATVCVPAELGGQERVVVACSLTSSSGEPLGQAASRLTLLTSLLSRSPAPSRMPGQPAALEPGAEKPLSSRQKSILAAMAEGMTNRQIAARIAFSESTVRLESMAIYRHFGVHTRAEAVAAARRKGELVDHHDALGA